MSVGVFFALYPWWLNLDRAILGIHWVLGIVLKQSTGTTLMCMLFQYIFFYKL